MHVYIPWLKEKKIMKELIIECRVAGEKTGVCGIRIVAVNFKMKMKMNMKMKME